MTRPVTDPAELDTGDHLTGPSPATISSLGQWLALSHRGITHVVKNGEFVFAIISPLFLAVCFYIPLRKMMSLQGIDYAQFLMPIIVLQAVGFAASSSAMRVSMDHTVGINTRFRVLPMHPAVPPLARLTTNFALLAVSVLFATIICLIIGWRPQGGVTGTLVLYGVIFAFGIIVSLLADGLGMVADGPETTSQLTALPIIILGMCSSGFTPIERFDEWIRPFIRNQPVSQIASAMRGINEGEATWDLVGPTVWWCVGLAAAAAGLITIGMRKAARAGR